MLNFPNKKISHLIISRIKPITHAQKTLQFTMPPVELYCQLPLHDLKDPTEYPIDMGQMVFAHVNISEFKTTAFQNLKENHGH